MKLINQIHLEIIVVSEERGWGISFFSPLRLLVKKWGIIIELEAHRGSSPFGVFQKIILYCVLLPVSIRYFHYNYSIKYFL